ncbi:spermidine/putrescine ABC transporter permease [Suicoccus acidiformans]|uniref:Spermidine/putrescine ABC transporter permease n=1 Tax=Suicoccus acidiformans TaxID=2036206 RepID=A0A347WJR9_9LACT|nr:ABC transporter permease [Suicoccus acidiformans]AXY25326.1 spermidine/putrescine ABC transporter permease [Suicoccus acidiformans]
MNKSYQRLSVPYYLWLIVFVVGPILLLVYQSFFDIHGNVTLGNYIKYFTSWNYMQMTLNSFLFAFLITLLTLVVAYPFAYFMTRSKRKDLWLLLVILPAWVNLLLKAYAFIGILSKDGWIASTLASLGFFEEGFLFSNTAFIFVAAYVELPFMIQPLYQALDAIPERYIIASQDLGASAWQTFHRIIWPLSMDGVRSGVQTVFIPSLSMFLITRLIGGNRIITLGTAVEQHYLVTQDWGMGSTIGVILVLLMFLIMNLTKDRKKGVA